MPARPIPAAHAPPEDDALARLLSAERRLAERIATARGAAEETLRQAREDAQRSENSCAAMIQSREAELVAQYQSRGDLEIAGIARSLSADAARFDNVDTSRLNELVAFVIERLLPADPKEPAP